MTSLSLTEAQNYRQKITEPANSTDQEKPEVSRRSPTTQYDESPTDVCTPVFLPAFFTIAKRWKHPKSPSMEGWINNMCYIHTMEYYSAFKNNKILTHSTAWVNLDDVKLNETEQIQKDKHCIILVLEAT